MTSGRFDDWHRLFGLTLTDVFQDTPWRVELEKDLAMQRQLLDVVIIEQTAPGAAAADLPVTSACITCSPTNPSRNRWTAGRCTN